MRIRSEHLDAIFDAAGDCVAEGGLAVRINGGCMNPVLTDGERVTVRRHRILLPGDIVVFRNSTTLVAHRMIGWASTKAGLGIVTRGDHCDAHDGVVTRDRILGRIDKRVAIRDRVRALGSFLRIVLRKMAGR